MKGIIGAALILFCCVWTGGRIMRGIDFTQNCGGNLKRAADANTVELAQQELAVAIKYAEARGLTSGYTSIVYRTPDEDVGFWYRNLKSAAAELAGIKPDATQLERTNVLMKLRETLLDKSGGGESITAPDGISVHPSNGEWALYGWLTGIGAIVGVCLIVAAAADY